MYYYYAYMEGEVCVDIERTRKQKSDLTDYIEVTRFEYDAYVNEETDSEFYIIGKLWNGSEWVLPTKFYYAVLNNRGIVVELVEKNDEVSDEKYIPITQAEYENGQYLHMKWDVKQEKFVEVPFVEHADTDTTRVSVANTNTSLQALLEQMQVAISNGSISADELSKLATKTDLQTLATKIDLQSLATKADMQGVASKADVSGTATKADLQALRNEIATMLSSSGGSVIKSIQRGTISAYDESYATTLSTPVNPDKCIVLIDGCKVSSTGDSRYGVPPYLVSLTETELKLNTCVGSSRDTGIYGWQIIEFN